jgi:membrane dipeptidase
MTLLSIADFHCDLLLFLGKDSSRTFHDPLSRCSLPQLKRGGVVFQNLAIFSCTESDSVAIGERQVQLFEKFFRSSHESVIFRASIENSSAFAGEEEPLDRVFRRLETWIERVGSLISLSLTWNAENRFGGGSSTDIGLKREGEILLEFLSNRGIPIDFSHTSDALAEDVLNFIDKKNLLLKVVATHSNFRSIYSHPRNLPDPIAGEIFRRGGVVGLNFIKPFIGNRVEDWVEHVFHAKNLGGGNQICLGADFFCDSDSLSLSLPRPLFFSQLSDASCYPYLMESLKAHLSPQEIENIASNTLLNFLGIRSLYPTQFKLEVNK